MDSHVGVDWASGSRVVVEATTETTDVSTESSLLNVWYEYRNRANEILVDIPAHLRCEGDRECDQEAKDFLGSFGSTVFWTLNSDAVTAEDYDDAVARNTRGLHTSNTIGNLYTAIHSPPKGRNGLHSIPRSSTNIETMLKFI